jgi:cation diffusion facilitator CzcD-associated flavoprotein CzcO
MTIAIPADSSLDIALIGAGPAGLAAAEVLSGAGRSVHLFDAMPSVGRKFLLAGKGGLNLTHAEPFEAFVTGAMASGARPSSRCCATLTPTRCAPGRRGWVWTPSWARRSGCFPPT